MSDEPGRMNASNRSMLPTDLINGIERVAGGLRFPVDAKAELLEQLGGRDATFTLRGITEVRAEMWVELLPAYIFPFASRDNCVEKLVEMYASSSSMRLPGMSGEDLGASIGAALEPLLLLVSSRLRGHR